MNDASRPLWLDEQPEIADWLHAALTRLDQYPAEQRLRPLRFPVSEKLFPRLTRHGDEADALWSMVQSLTLKLPLRIQTSRRRDVYGHDYEGAVLWLDGTCEPILRAWLERPRVSVEVERWQAAVDAARGPWTAVARAQLRARPVTIPGRAPEEVVDAFVRLHALRGEGCSQRELSARIFFGDSKFIERRAAGLVEVLYPDLETAPRPLVVNVWLPTTIAGVLFLENQESYTRAAAGGWRGVEQLALVYTAGFRGSAARVRSRGGAMLHLSGAPVMADSFERWWFQELCREWPLSFFGDLDFDGLDILKGLRRLFDVSAWRPGYGHLLHLLESGGGHVAVMNGKEGQQDPGKVGCDYADEVLRPALLRSGRFVDQEAFSGG